MSRIGSQPIPIPSGVNVDAKGQSLTVKGPKGTLQLELRPEVELKVEDGTLTLEPRDIGPARHVRAFHGLTRSLINNMVVGVSEGYERTLEIVGVGWNAQAKGQELTLNIGFCHPVIFKLPDGVECETPKPTTIKIRGADKQAVGQFAAHVRKVRPPEPYKGKGIRHQGEYVRRKGGKTFGS